MKGEEGCEERGEEVNEEGIVSLMVKRTRVGSTRQQQTNAETGSRIR